MDLGRYLGVNLSDSGADLINRSQWRTARKRSVREGNKERLDKGGGKAETTDVTETKEGQCPDRVLSNINYYKGVVNKDRRMFIGVSEKKYTARARYKKTKGIKHVSWSRGVQGPRIETYYNILYWMLWEQGSCRSCRTQRIGSHFPTFIAL